MDDLGSKKVAAARLGCHPSYLVHLLTDLERRPGLDIAFALERETAEWDGGQIRASEWAEPPMSRTGTDG